MPITLNLPSVLAVPGPEGVLTVAPLEVHASLVLVFAVPDFAVETEQARAALPSSVSHRTAATAAAKAAALVAGLARADAQLLAAALDDVLHAPHRRSLVRGYDAVTAAARTAGACVGRARRDGGDLRHRAACEPL